MRVGRSNALGISLIVIVLSIVNYSNILESTVVIGQFQRRQGSLDFGISIPAEQQQQQQQQQGRVELYSHDDNDHGDFKREKNYTTNARNSRIRNNKINNRIRHRQTSNGTVVIRRKHRNSNSNSTRSNYTTSMGGDAYADTSTKATILVLTDFFSHIPKTGGEYAFKALETILDSIPAYASQKKSRNVTRLCNQGVAKDVRQFSSYYPTDNQIATGQPRFVTMPQLKCQFHMSEADYSTINTAHKTYTILREPISHTLSMYYHCKESPAHKSKVSYMAKTLDEWLDTWANVSRYKKNNNNNNNNNQTAFVDARIAVLSKGLGTPRKDLVFKCYNPLDFQSQWTQFTSATTTTRTKNKKTNETTTNDDDHPPPPSNGRNGYNDDWKRQLQQQYVVLGDHGQMDKTVCLMFLEYTQGEYGIPKVCDCTTTTNATANATTTTATTIIRKQRRRLSSSSSSSFLDLAYDPSKHSHGVLHHGSNVDTLLTKPQRELIRTEIRPRDVELYRLGREIFSEQVVSMEDKLQIRICDTFRTDA
ncbi:hypothetical protein IV203_027109 [Nitzschia inconspicua]|uniref:Sulfotransferase n=1 Tax=Nitzschia inconspicua TaxID=303405 RepID=A0A9K3PXY2_9STRA|nr:hypothetical protein IV203_027109 [Nitzschia inconspicua]